MYVKFKITLCNTQHQYANKRDRNAPKLKYIRESRDFCDSHTHYVCIVVCVNGNFSMKIQYKWQMENALDTIK